MWNLILNLFGAGADGEEGGGHSGNTAVNGGGGKRGGKGGRRGGAVGTVGGDAGGVAAVVAGEGGGLLVERQGDVAVRTAGCPAALPTFDEGGESAAILEEDDLFVAVECSLHGFDEPWGEKSSHEFFPFCLFGIDDFDGGELLVLVALGELYVAVAFLPCQVIDLEGGGGGAEEGFGTEHVGKHDGGVAGMIAWRRLLLLVTLFVLFVYDDEAEVLEGEEDAGTDAENELVGGGGGLPFVDFQPLHVSKLGMVNAHAVAEYVAKTFGDLGGEGNFGEEVEDLFPLL